ncbi:MAG: BTAD domain-containing putative transcriptional regulator, partial [Acidimicrobiales bacterium]
MSTTVRLGVLGAFEVRRANEPVVIGSTSQRRLLSVLVAHAGEVVSADRLADIVWLGSPPPSAAASLQTLVWRLRVLLDTDVIVTTPPGYALGATWVDAHEFERLLRGKSLDEALSLWRGRPFAEFADEDWARPSVVRLEELHAMARELQVDKLLASDRVDEAVAAAEALCAAEPFRERAHGVLIQALAKQGRAAEALRAFENFRRFLAEESGLEPSAALIEISRTVLAQEADDAPSGAELRTGNLPAQQSSFVGRGREVAELTVLLGEARIVSLTGVGGVGKTRLALQVAAEVSPRFRHGAWMVELAPVRDPKVVVDAIAAVFAITPGPGVDVIAMLARFLRHRELLLLLDNCEHLLDSLVELVRALERVCPKLVVLATSREGLGIAGERIIGVLPMPLPASDDRDGVLHSDAARLFVERAVAVKSDFAVTDANAAAIAEIVRRLDGIPLALELAASRVPVLSPIQLAQRLTQRFRVLGGGERGAIERHATLRAAIDWSYEMLDKNQQRLLVRLSVFAGGCSLEGAEAVCSDSDSDEVQVLDLLAALVARSLVVVDDVAWGERRYRLLETIRQYAEEQLDAGQRTEICHRHAGFYVNFAETAARQLRGPDQLRWLQQVEVELENLRTAMAW